MKRYFEYIDDKSSKFWAIELTGDESFWVYFGKIGSSGTPQEKEFDNKEIRDKEANKLIAEKLKKGYKEIGEKTDTEVKPEKVSPLKLESSTKETKTKKYENIGKYMQANEALFPKLIVGDYDLNYNHFCETGVSDFCISSAVWLCSVSNTGHDHIGIMPVVGRAVEEWPVGILDQTEGTITTFASSIKSWLPGYFIQDGSGELDDYKKEISKILKPFLGDLAADFIKLMSKSTDFSKLYEFVEPGSFLHEYYLLLEKKKFNLADWKAYMKKYPFYNAPLQYLLDEGKADKEIYERLLNCVLRHDLGNHSFDYLEDNAKEICKLFTKEETPLYPLLVKMRDKPGDYHHMGDAFYEAGLEFKKQKKYWEAYCCFDNSVWAERCESEEFREDAYLEQVKVAKAMKDKAFFSQYDDACMPDEE